MSERAVRTFSHPGVTGVESRGCGRRRTHPVPLALPPWLKPGLPRLVVVHPAAQVVVLSDGVVQFGSDPGRGAVLLPAGGEDAERIVEIIRAAVQPQSMSSLAGKLRAAGMIASRARHVVQELLVAGVLVDCPPQSVQVLLIGQGQPAALVAAALARMGVEVRRPRLGDSAATMAARGPASMPVVVVNHARVEQALAAVAARRSLTVIPVVVQAGGVTVGPVQWRGEGPCLVCAQLYRQQAWQRWPQEGERLLAWPEPGVAGGVLDAQVWREHCAQVAAAAVYAAVLQLVGWSVVPPQGLVGAGARVHWSWPGLLARVEKVACHPACPECFSRSAAAAPGG